MRTIFSRIIVSFVLGFVLVCGVFAAAQKQEGAAGYPSRNIEFIVGSTAGSGSDLMARALAMEMKLSQPIIVVNRAGAGGTVATTEVKNARADGHTILYGAVGPFVTQPHLLDIQYSLDDFRYIAPLAYEPLFLAVKADSPWKTPRDLNNAFAKGGGQTLKFGSSSPGSVPHLAQEVLFKQMNISADHVPFPGDNEAIIALLGGHIQALTAHVGGLIKHVEAGELRLLGIYSPNRFELTPNVPTLKEQGYDINLSAYRFIAVSKALPNDIVGIIEKAANEAKNTPSFIEFLKRIYALPYNISEAELTAQIKRDNQMYGVVIKELGLKN